MNICQCYLPISFKITFLCAMFIFAHLSDFYSILTVKMFDQAIEESN